jgi:glycosyltransferase involved in cell wall biosynthesis
MLQLITTLLREGFDATICDFLAAASHFPDLSGCLLFQHNVETALWRRHAQQAPDPLRKFYFRLQAARMLAYEGAACRAASHIVAVSKPDAESMRSLFGVSRISEIATGVNLEFFSPPASAPPTADLVFIGSMDWMANIHGVQRFVDESLPLIRRGRPACSLAIVGRAPAKEITSLAERDPNIIVTGTVPDVRPWLWGSLVSIVPLYIGGGTRLKIYESMAAKIPVVSTSIGAEGLLIHPPQDIRIADTPEAFAEKCVGLLEDPDERSRMAAAAWELVSSNFSWERVALSFERILQNIARP